MAVTFNGTERFIEVTDPADIVLDAQRDLYSAWKVWQQASTVNAGYAPAFRTFGGDQTVVGQNAPRYYFLINGWRVRINNNQVVSVALNLYSEDYSSPYVVVPGSGVSDRNSDAVSINQEALEFASFNGGVTLDDNNITTKAVSGIDFPTGTRGRPSNNTADTKTIASNRGLSKVFVLGNLNLQAGDTFSGFEFVGESTLKTTVQVLPDANILNCEFYDCSVSGVLDGNSQIERGVISDLQFIDGFVYKCAIGPAVIALAPDKICNLFSCYSTVPGTSTPIIDGSGSGILALRDYHGGMLLRNFTDPTKSHSIDLSSGQIKLDTATVTAGTFVVRGVGKLIDELGNPITTGIWNGGVNIINELLTSDNIGGGGSSPWTTSEKDEVIAYAKKASDNAEQVNNKIN